MSGRYRCIVLALVGWLSLAASTPNNPVQQNQQQSAARVEQSLNAIATALQEANKAQRPDRGCEQGRDDRSSDLCAQWKAADAARIAADWTRRTFWLNVLAVFVGALTLFAAGYAAWYAAEAAGSADKTLKHAEQLALVQNRPYLVPSRLRIQPKEEGIYEIRATIRNVGNLVAEKVSVSLAAGFFPLPVSRDFVFRHREPLVFGIMSPASEKGSIIASRELFSNEQIEQVRQVQAIILAEVHVTYRPNKLSDEEIVTLQAMAILDDVDGGRMRIVQNYIFEHPDADSEGQEQFDFVPPLPDPTRN